MALEKDFIKNNLQPLVSQVGGEDKVQRLPLDTIIQAAAHTDDILAISIREWVIEIPDLDITIGYEVYNKNFELLYNEAEDLELEYQAWGTTERDVYLVWSLGYGDYVYLTYKVEGESTERVLMLIKF